MKYCKRKPQRSNEPSLTMPTTRHFWNRQNWHRLRRRLSMMQLRPDRQTYFEFFWTVLYRVQETTAACESTVTPLTHDQETCIRNVFKQLAQVYWPGWNLTQIHAGSCRHSPEIMNCVLSDARTVYKKNLVQDSMSEMQVFCASFSSLCQEYNWAHWSVQVYTSKQLPIS